ncbi:hypothetical protein BC567DRAFT_230106 [Phyllosticta citribraziliensis]
MNMRAGCSSLNLVLYLSLISFSLEPPFPRPPIPCRYTAPRLRTYQPPTKAYPHPAPSLPSQIPQAHPLESLYAVLLPQSLCLLFFAASLSFSFASIPFPHPHNCLPSPRIEHDNPCLYVM